MSVALVPIALPALPAITHAPHSHAHAATATHAHVHSHSAAKPEHAAKPEPIGWPRDESCRPRNATELSCPASLEVPIAARKLVQALFAKRPLRFLHMQKSGTGFANTVVRLGMRGGNYTLPPGAAYQNSSFANGLLEYYHRCFPRALKSRALRDTAAQLVAHSPLQAGDIDRWAVVTMLREPVSRAVSHYRFTAGHGVPFWQYVRTNRTANPQIAGCMTKNLIGRGCEDGPYPSPAEVAEARRRLAGFAFVGIAGEWTASVCAAHALFGAGPSYLTEVFNLRPTGGKEQLPADGPGGKQPDLKRPAAEMEAELRARGRVDPTYYDWADEEVYRFGRQLFRSFLEKG